MTKLTKLSTIDMAHFAAEGFVRLDAVVPDDINRMFMNELKADEHKKKPERFSFSSMAIPAIPPGTEVLEAFDPDTAIGEIMRLPRVRGAIESLVGPGSVVDHHFVHTLPPTSVMRKAKRAQISQHLHQDSTIDPRQAFDIQLFYFPHDVPPGMGGTRFVPGTHLRIVSESAIARYQNVRGQQHIECSAGTIFCMHHGIWHGGSVNHTEEFRYLYKLRLNPVVPQIRLWAIEDLEDSDDRDRPIFFVKEARNPQSIPSVLTRGLPWFENDTGRIEYIQRIKFWRRLVGDPNFDADYWVSRLECEPTVIDD